MLSVYLVTFSANISRLHVLYKSCALKLIRLCSSVVRSRVPPCLCLFSLRSLNLEVFSPRPTLQPLLFLLQLTSELIRDMVSNDRSHILLKHPILLQCQVCVAAEHQDLSILLGTCEGIKMFISLF